METGIGTEKKSPRKLGLRAQVAWALTVFVLLNLTLTLVFVRLTVDAATGAALLQQQEVAMAAAKGLEKQEDFVESALSGVAKTEDALNLGAIRARQMLNQIRLQNPAVVAFGAYDLSGQIWTTSKVLDSNPDLPRGFINPSLLKHIRQGVPVRTPLWWAGKYPYQAQAVPLLDRNLRITGALVATVEVSGFWPSVRNMGEYGRSQVYVTDSEGRFLVSRDLSLLSAPGPVPFLAGKAQAKETWGGVYPGIDGNPVLGAWTILKDSGWIVVAEINADWVFSAFQSLYWLVGLQLMMGLALGLVFWFFLERQVVGPLVRISEGAGRFGQGQFDFQVKVKAGPEIDSLAEGLNRMASQLAGLIEHLEERVADRTQELSLAREETERSYRELQRTQAHLIESDRQASLGKLVAGVAHEINTPVGNALTLSTVLMGQAESLRTQVATERLDQTVFLQFLGDLGESTGLIYQNLTRAADLITSFKKVAVNQSSEEARDFELLPLLQDIAMSLRHELKVNGHQIILDCPAPIHLVTYQGLLIQILTNLIQNSLFHGFQDRREGRITIRASQEPSHLVLDYWDDGVGIPQELRAKVFEPFFTTRRAAGGSGLGLSIVKNIVTGPLGGTIDLASRPGEGVHFRILIPPIEPAQTKEPPE